jgi:hypothetical protein
MFPVPVISVTLVLSLPFSLAARMIALVAGYIGCNICSVGGCDIAAPMRTRMVVLPVPLVSVAAALSLPFSLAARTVTFVAGDIVRGVCSVCSVCGGCGSDGIVYWESQSRGADGEDADGSEADERTHL